MVSGTNFACVFSMQCKCVIPVVYIRYHMCIHNISVTKYFEMFISAVLSFIIYKEKKIQGKDNNEWHRRVGGGGR